MKLIIEVGSSNTKIHKIGTDRTETVVKTFNLKKMYIEDKNKFWEKCNELYDFVEKQKSNYNHYAFFAFGTSLFRTIEQRDINRFKKEFNDKIGENFKVLSQTDEINYTILATIKNIKKTGNYIVLNTGGGSTEVINIKEGKTETLLTVEYGIANVNYENAELSKNENKLDLDDIMLSITKKIKINDITEKNMPVILTGGQHIDFFEKMKITSNSNMLFSDKDLPFLVSYNDYYDSTKSLFKRPLENYYTNEGEEKWWEGARGCAALVLSVCKQFDSEIIIPTNLNCIDGINVSDDWEIK